MASPDGPYSRVYHSVWTDERFVEIIDDDALLGAWTRLLMLADAAWPESVAIPRRISKRSLAALVRAGVIELHPADTYRIHGLDPERQRRSDHGRAAIARRWHSNTPSNTPSNTQSLLAPRPRTTSIEIPLTGDDGGESAERGGWLSHTSWAYLSPVVVELTGRNAAQGKFAEMLCELAEQAGPERVIQTMRDVALAMEPVKPSLRSLAFSVEDIIRKPVNGKDVAVRVAERQATADQRRRADKEAAARRKDMFLLEQQREMN